MNNTKQTFWKLVSIFIVIIVITTKSNYWVQGENQYCQNL